MAENNHTPVEDQSLSLHQIIDSSPALLHTARPDGDFDFTSQTWPDFAGEPPEKLLGWCWIAWIHPVDVEAFVEQMRESFAKKRPVQQASRIRRSEDGYWRIFDHKVTSLLCTNEKFVLYGGEHSNQAGSSFVLLLAPASMQPALDTYQRSCGPG